MAAPLISIVTVTWNAAECVGTTMRSLQQQTFRDFEHLVIDGASSDNTLDIIKANASERLTVVSEPDKGLYDAMNKGLHLAKGRYVLFLNAGDSFASPTSLEAYAQAAATGDYDIIYSDTDLVDSKGKITGHRHLSVPEKLTHKSFSKGMLVCHQAFMMLREKAPEYDLSYRFSADYDWTVKCIGATRAERCCNLQGVHIHYLSDGLTDKNRQASLKERFRIMCRHYGTPLTVARHLTFIPRFLMRKIKAK